MPVVVDRRLEILKLEGMGAQPKIAKQIGQKRVSSRSIYWGLHVRSKWQPPLLQLKDRDNVMQKIINRYE